VSQAEPVPPAGAPGAQFLAEIHEQPAALRRLLAHEDAIARAAALAIERDARLIRLVGHGSSDNTAISAGGSILPSRRNSSTRIDALASS